MDPNLKDSDSIPQTEQFSFDPWKQLSNAIQLISNQDRTNWTTFGIFWPTNGLLLVALFSKGDLPIPVIGLIVSLAGLSFSIIWASIQRRTIGYINYYENLICRIEARFNFPADLAVSKQINKQLFNDSMVGSRSIRVFAKNIGFYLAFFWGVAAIYFLVRLINQYVLNILACI